MGKVNKKKQENLKLTRVVELLEYHRDFGKFYWIKKSSKYSNIKVGGILMGRTAINTSHFISTVLQKQQ